MKIKIVYENVKFGIFVIVPPFSPFILLLSIISIIFSFPLLVRNFLLLFHLLSLHYRLSIVSTIFILLPGSNLQLLESLEEVEGGRRGSWESIGPLFMEPEVAPEQGGGEMDPTRREVGRGNIGGEEERELRSVVDPELFIPDLDPDPATNF